MDNRVNIRLIESRDIAAFFPSGLRDTCVGWAVDLDGALACIVGVSRQRSLMVAFSKMKPGVASKRLIWQTAKLLNKLVVDLPYNEIWTLTTNGKFLRALGWEFVGSVEQVEVFKWTR